MGGDDSYLTMIVGRDSLKLGGSAQSMRNGDPSDILRTPKFKYAMQVAPPTEDKEAAMSATFEFVNNYEENKFAFKVNGIWQWYSTKGGAAPTNEDLTLYVLPYGERQTSKLTISKWMDRILDRRTIEHTG